MPVGDLADEMPQGRTKRATSEYVKAYDALVLKCQRLKCRDVTEYVSKWRDREQELRSKECGDLVTRYNGNMEVMKNKQPFLTKNGYVGMGPLVSKLGDVVVVFVGAQTPFVLRPQDQVVDRRFVLLGEAYCHMAMDGEILLTGRKEHIFLV